MMGQTNPNSSSLRDDTVGSLHDCIGKNISTIALHESSEDFLCNPHYTSHLFNPENYSPSNYRTLIKPGVAENGGKARSHDISSTRKMIFHI